MSGGESALRTRTVRLWRALRERGQSETIGVAFLTGIVLVLATLVGLFLFADLGSESDEQLLADIETDVEASNITLGHEGGDTFEPGNLSVVVTGDTEREYTLGDDFSATEGGGGAVAPGDTWRADDPAPIIGEGRLLVIHQPTNTVIRDNPYSVSPAAGGVTLSMTDWIAGPDAVPTNTDETTIHAGKAWNYSVTAAFPDGTVISVDPDNVSFDGTGGLAPTGDGKLQATSGGSVTPVVSVDRPGINATDGIDVTIFDSKPSPNITKDSFNVVAGNSFDVPVEVTGVTGGSSQGSVSVVVDPEVDDNETKTIAVGGTETFTFDTESGDGGNTYTITANLTVDPSESDTADLAVQLGNVNITVELENGQTQNGSVLVGPSVGTTSTAITADSVAAGGVSVADQRDTDDVAGDSAAGEDGVGVDGDGGDGVNADGASGVGDSDTDTQREESADTSQKGDSRIVGAGDGEFTAHGPGGTRSIDAEDSDMLTESGDKLLGTLGLSQGGPDEVVNVQGDEYVQVTLEGAGGGGGGTRETGAWRGGDGGKIEDAFFSITDFKELEFYTGLGGQGGRPDSASQGGSGYADGGDGTWGGTASERWAASGAGGGATAIVGVHPNGDTELLALAAGGGGGTAVVSDGPSTFVEDKSSSGGGGGPFGNAGVRITSAPFWRAIPPWTGGPGESGEFIMEDWLGLSGGDGGNTYITFNCGLCDPTWLVDGESGLSGGTIVDSGYLVTGNSIVGGGADGGSGGTGGDEGEDGEDGEYDYDVGDDPNRVEVTEFDGPTAIELDEDLGVDYTVEKTVGYPIEAFVDLEDRNGMGYSGRCGGTFWNPIVCEDVVDADESLGDPLELRSETHSSSLYYEGGDFTGDDIEDTYSENETIEWRVYAFDKGKGEMISIRNGETFYGNPLRLGLDKTPDRISPEQNLSVTYNLTNIDESGGIDQTVRSVNLSLTGPGNEPDTDQFVVVKAGESTFGKLVYSDVASDYSAGDTIQYRVDPQGGVGATGPDAPWDDLSKTGTVDVVEPANLTITGVDAPAEIDITNTTKLEVEYTVENVGNLSATDTIVLSNDSQTFDTESLNVGPRDSTNSTQSGTLTLSSLDTKYDSGDTVDWNVSLTQGSDSVEGQTDIIEEANITIQSLDVPDQVAPNETLQVGYTLTEHTGLTNGTVSFVNMQVYGEDNPSSDVNVDVPAGGTVSGTLNFGVPNVSAAGFKHNDVIKFNVSLSNFDDISEDRQVDVEGEPAFELVDMQVQDDIVSVGEMLEVTYEVKNTGTAPGQTSVEMRVEGEEDLSMTVPTEQLDPGGVTNDSMEMKMAIDELDDIFDTDLNITADVGRDG